MCQIPVPNLESTFDKKHRSQSAVVISDTFIPFHLLEKRGIFTFIGHSTYPEMFKTGGYFSNFGLFGRDTKTFNNCGP